MKANRLIRCLMVCGITAGGVGTGLASESLTKTVSVQELRIADVLRLAEQASPDLKAAQAREQEATARVRILKSLYYPTADVQAIDSFGFPGSTGYLGIGGLMGSPYRSGPAGGLVSRLDLVDFTRSYSVRAAQYDLQAVQEETSILRFQIYQAALRYYFDASRFRGQMQTWGELIDGIQRVYREVEHFVSTGQRSVVERMLIKDQMDEATMTSAGYQARYQVALQRLARFIGRKSDDIACAPPDQMNPDQLFLQTSANTSPLILKAMAESSAARIRVSQYTAMNYPTVDAMASVGDMDTARLVRKKYYSGGFGIDVPLFEGYRISGQIQQARQSAKESEMNVAAAQLQVDELNGQYDETIQASDVELHYLKDELALAKNALKLAMQRYYAFQGTLVDVREAIRNLERVQTQMNDVKTDWLYALGAKAVLNGASVSESK